jgi:predicted enzyme related to lactoylglutathione lyase
MESPLGTVILYARDMQKSAAFYARHFGFVTSGEVVEGLIELTHPGGGAGILIHQAAKSVKLGQVGVKLSFHVKDVRAFAAQAALQGLAFGPCMKPTGTRSPMRRIWTRTRSASRAGHTDVGRREN